ncbi:DNA methyltransferase [Naasia lichenicola]|uniref:site-specific DNA-methyltransferase (adenine-specific) n=1 Tax=Naasia lichenicola TaxID=2565933 RepID=A0A4S4FN63_9MICO|nr:DNA methyltransferase [Naasia lichenicola]THG30686.1 class I SAM-dependent DNA methyltransferase [Naasia lichenicola]THG31923.1 class I SAM-dependent DNA methyltransferase [Naasia lichenicola]
MHLAWNEITARAAKFATEWAGETRETSESQTFWTEFLEVFGINRKRAGGYFEYAVKLAGKKYGFIDMFLPGKMLVEQKSSGRDLSKAQGQALSYLDGLTNYDLPNIIVTCDFSVFQILDLETREVVTFPLEDLPKHVREFAILVDEAPQKYEEQNPVNREAAERMAALHNAIEATGYRGHKLELLLVRLVFCLFAEDSRIFELNQFQNYIRNRTQVDGTDLGPKMSRLFEVLNTKPEERSTALDDDLAAFPYINGGLFSELIPIPDFDTTTRFSLLMATRPDWSKVSPAIFGAMFQGVMNEDQRHDIGAHYTSEENILRVIKPLFLDDLYAELEPLVRRRSRTQQEDKEDKRVRANRLARLDTFHDKIANLNFFDPACGCGNFLVIAYRELRRLEHRVVAAMAGGTALLDVTELLRVRVEQFHGIEIEEFPALIARTALWLTDHQMNMEASEQLGEHYTRLPLTEGANIVWANALTKDWGDVVKPDQLDFIMGNPPFLGSRVMSKPQKVELKAVAKGYKQSGFLDYVTGWYIKADKFLDVNPDIQVAFVSTSSISQGEQPGILWKKLLANGAHINFAHRTFRWTNGAKGIARVHCVIVGFGRKAKAQKELYEYPDITGEPVLSLVPSISPYLIEGDEYVVSNRENQISSMLPMAFGNMPADDGNLLLSTEERDYLVAHEPAAAAWILPCYGAREFIRKEDRYALWLEGISPSELKAMPLVYSRVEANKANRAKSARPELASIPHLFAQRTQSPKFPFLLIPSVSSESRRYVPMGFFEPGVVTTNLNLAIQDGTLELFAVLTSQMHMDWMRLVGGRLESRYRYSKDVVYNNFIFPKLTDQHIVKLQALGQAVLDARAAYPNESLANLYDDVLMPFELRKAHDAIDVYVDSLYREEEFAGWEERVRHLLALHKQHEEALTV